MCIIRFFSVVGLFFSLFLTCFKGIVKVEAEVVRPAADFSWRAPNPLSPSLYATSSFSTLQSRLGQPCVVLFAPSSSSGKFRSQVLELERVYQKLAARHVLCFMALTRDQGGGLSNIPFIEVVNPLHVAERYGVHAEFAIAIIGPDGNLDDFSSSVLPAQRVLDVMDNSYLPQKMLRQ